MLIITSQVDNLKGLSKHIEIIKYFSKQKDFQDYFKECVLKELDNVMVRNFTTTTTDNDEYISLYKSSNKIKDTDDGFILYNDATILANAKDTSTYPNGQFSIALAFEYGVGIKGEGTYDGENFQPWEYNVNKYNFGWYYKDTNGDKKHTYGYMGYHIYSDLAFNIKHKMNNIVKDYIKKVGG